MVALNREMVLLVELAVFEESVYFGSNIGIQFNSDFFIENHNDDPKSKKWKEDVYHPWNRKLVSRVRCKNAGKSNVEQNNNQGFQRM